MSDNDAAVVEVLRKAKLLAQRYRKLTGKPLGIPGEVAEYETARILGLELTPARNTGLDATEQRAGHSAGYTSRAAVFARFREGRHSSLR
jgi:hypothetical protein